jgi:hypothetical protein
LGQAREAFKSNTQYASQDRQEAGLRAPLAPGSPINLQRRRRWTNDFSTYRHQISEHAINDWMEQFAEGHRDVAARLLDVIDFYSMERISGAFRTALSALPGWHMNKAQRQGVWRFAGLSKSAGESADAMMHRFRIANGLDAKKYNELFIHPSQILLERLGPDDTLILIDDFVGTGDSVCTAWDESFSELIPDIGRVYLVVVAAMTEGRVRIGNHTSMTCVSGVELTDADKFFSNYCAAFSAAEKNTILDYCRRAHKREPKGYKECGLVVVFQHRSPNNSLPILHTSNRRWTGLFPRHG